MPTVRIEPAGIDLDVKPNEAVAEAAWRQGYTWPTKCYGQAECMVCFVTIVDGELSIEPADDAEESAMRMLMPKRLRGPLTRLGCRLKVTGSGVVLEKKGVRPPGDPEPDEDIDGANAIFGVF